MRVNRLLLACLVPLVGCLDQPFATNVDLPLQVIAIHPSDGARGIARDAVVQVVFNLDVVEGSVTAADAILVEDVGDGDNPVALEGERAYLAGADAPPTFTFTPSSLLPYSTRLRVTVTTAVERAATQGIPEGALLKQVVATFTTEDPPPLEVLAVAPSAGATGVARDTTISVTFSEPVACASLEGAFSAVEIVDPLLGGGTVDVGGTWACPTPPAADIPAAEISCDGGACTSVFTPAAPFAYSSLLELTLKGGPRDAGPVESFRATDDGGQLRADVSWSFRVADPPPLVLVTSEPGSGADNVAPDTTLTLTFSEDVDCASLQAALDDGTLAAVETLDGGGAGAVQTLTLDACSGAVASLSFSPGFSLSSTVEVTVPDTIRSTRATSVGGNLVGGAVIAFFIIDPPPLRVVSTTPGGGAVSVATTTNLFVELSEDIDCASVVAGDVIVRETYDTETAAALGAANVEHAVTVVSCAGSSLELDIGVELQLTSGVDVTLPGEIRSARATSQGGFLEGGAGYGWSFTTADPPSLLVVFTSPGHNNRFVPVDEPIIVTFSEALDLASVSDTSFVVELLDGAGGNVVGVALSSGCGTAGDANAAGTPCSYVPSDGDTTVTFTPLAELAYDNWYRFTLDTSIKSARSTSAGGSLSQPLVYEMKTIVTPPVEVTSLEPSADIISPTPTFAVTFNQEVFALDFDGADADVWLAPVAQAGDAPDIANAVPLDCAACAGAGTSFQLSPVDPLTEGLIYVLVVAGDLDGVRGTSGGSLLLADYTRDYLVGQAQLLAFATPADTATDVSVASPVCATFLETVDMATVDESSFAVEAESDLGVRVPVALDQFTVASVNPITGIDDGSYTDNVVCFRPAPATYPCRDALELLPANTTVSVTLAQTIASTSGTTLGADQSWSFSTGGLPVVVDAGFDALPALGFAGALDDPEGVPVTASLWLMVSDAVDPATLGQVELIGPGGPIAASVSAEDDGTLLRVQPDAQLAFDGDLSLAVTGGALGLLFADGRYLATDQAWPLRTSTAPAAAISPPQGETGYEAMIAPAVFSRPMYLPSINSETFTAFDDTTGVALSTVVGTNVDDDDSATLMPVPTWPDGDSVTVTLTTGVLDARGNPLAADVSVTYAAIAGAPALAARTPGPMTASVLDVADAAQVSGDQRFTVTFPASAQKSEYRMLPLTLNARTVLVSSTDSGCDARTFTTKNTFSVGAAGGRDVVVFWADQLLRSSCPYEVRLLQKDFANIHTASPAGGGGPPPDIVIGVSGETTAPALDGATPADAAPGVAATAVLSYDFSEAMDPASFGAGAVTLSDGAGPVVGSISVVGDLVTFTPDAPLSGGVQYTAVVSGTVSDLAGNVFGGDSRTFTVENAAPTVVSITLPGDGTIQVSFSEAMDVATVSPDTLAAAGTLQVADTANGNATVYGCVALDDTGTVATFAPVEPLVAGVAYAVSVTSGASDLGGTALDTTGATATLTP